MGFRTPVSAIESDKWICSECANLRVNFALAKFLGRLISKVRKKPKQQGKRLRSKLYAERSEVGIQNPR